MIRFPGEAPVPDAVRDGVIALGNFDGFHLGHQAVVGRAIARARSEGRPALVATFDPHPVRWFRPDVEPFRLTTLDQRQRLFAAAGADGMIVYRFDAALAASTAEQFIARRLAGDAGAAGVVTGEDFTFGRDRSGNVAALHELSARHGIVAEAVAPVAADGEPVSSSRIRAALKAGDCAMAAGLLTRPFAITGEVVHGDKRGRELGYPTANLLLGDYLRPRYGIYAVRARLPDGRVLEGAANLGVRPQFDPPKELLETYFFDWSSDLYGQVIEVELIAFLRPEASFEGLEALSAQMARDCEDACRELSRAP